jgi:hypothetical protein
MRRFSLLGLLLLIPVCALLVVTPGCGKKGGKPADTKDGGDKDGGDDGGDDETASKEKTELKTTGWGTLKGTVTLDGSMPKPASLEDQIQANAKDRDYCDKGLSEERVKQEWKVNKDKRVANVVVWLRAPAGTYFKLPAKDEWPNEWTKPVIIDQPHCAFVPHVAVAWPKYYDPKKKDDPVMKGLVASGQKFMVANSATIQHNTKIAGSAKFNPPFPNQTLQPKLKGKVFAINPDNGPITLNCDIHKWMSGKVWAFDHPYAAVTKGDHEKNRDDDEAYGTYEIKMVPTGKELYLVAWHESAGYIFGKEGKKITLKEGDNTQDFKVKSK